jgi:hypothetical protein
MKRLFRSLLSFLSLAIQVPPMNLVTNPANLEVQGGIVPAWQIVALINALNNFNLADATPNFQSSAGATITLTGLAGLYQKLTNGGAVTVTIDSAYNIVNTMQSPFNGEAFGFAIFSSGAGTVATPTLSDSAVTLSGTTSIAAGNRRSYVGQITQLATTVGMPVSAGTTFTSIAQVGSTNNFTVTLGVNSLVPVVGTAILLTNITGTLPAGWYPINKVTSATSFVVALPPGTVWTATAASVPGTPVIPVSAYTPGLTAATGGAGSFGLYSPTITITAQESVAAIV